MKVENIQLFFEEVLERRGECVLVSNVRPATAEEIEVSAALHKTGKCDGVIIVDEAGWPYDFRNCGICGRGLGTV